MQPAARARRARQLLASCLQHPPCGGGGSAGGATTAPLLGAAARFAATIAQQHTAPPAAVAAPPPDALAARYASLIASGALRPDPRQAAVVERLGALLTQLHGYAAAMRGYELQLEEFKVRRCRRTCDRLHRHQAYLGH